MEPLSHGAGCQQHKVLTVVQCWEYKERRASVSHCCFVDGGKDEQEDGGSAYNSCNKGKQMLCNLLLGIS